MKRSIIFLFPIGSIISMILVFVFPILRYEVAPSEFVPFWIWGYRYLPIIDGINILDIPQKIISLLLIILMIFTLRSIFSLRKTSSRLDFVTDKWQGWGFWIIALDFFWFLGSLISGSFSAPYGFIFDLPVILPLISGLFLIFGRIYFMRFIVGRTEKQDYTNLIWLEKQHVELNKTIQEIANEQNVSMLTIENWINKIEKDKK